MLALALSHKTAGHFSSFREVLRALFAGNPSRWEEIAGRLGLTFSEMLALRDLIPPGAESACRLADLYRKKGLESFARQEYYRSCREARNAPARVRAYAARHLAELGRPEDALRFLSAWIEADRLEADYKIARADLLAKKGSMGGAIADLVDALRQRPRDGGARQRLADYYARAGKLRQAEKTLREGVRLQPRLPVSYEALVDFYAKHRRYEDAAATLRQLMRIYAFEPKYVIRLGDIYQRQGAHFRAMQTYEEAIRMGAPASGLKQRIEKCRKAHNEWLLESEAGKGTSVPVLRDRSRHL